MFDLFVGGALALGGALLGEDSGDYPQAPNIPPPPNFEDMLDAIDEISGTEAIVATGPDGKKRQILRRLPRTPEMQALYDSAGDMVRTSSDMMKRLYAESPTAAVNYNPFIQSLNTVLQRRSREIENLVKIPDFKQFKEEFKNLQRDTIEREFTIARNQKTAELARMGYGMDSTAQAQADAILTQEKAHLLAKTHVESQIAADQLMAQDMANRSSAYNLLEGRNNAELHNQESVVRALEAQRAGIESNRVGRIKGQEALFNLGSGIQANDFQKALGTQANQMKQAQYNNAMMAYGGQTNAMNQNYQNQVANYNNRPPSFSDVLGAGLTTFSQPFMNRAATSFADKILGPEPVRPINVNLMRY